MFNLTQPQIQQASGGNAMNITSDMPEMQPCSFEKFYTIIIKNICVIIIEDPWTYRYLNFNNKKEFLCYDN